MDVDLPNGLMTNGVMMKTIMSTATGMVELVVTIMRLVGIHTARNVNALSQGQQQQLQQLQQPLRQQQRLLPLQHLHLLYVEANLWVALEL